MVEESGRRRSSSSSSSIKWRRQQEEAEKAVEAALEAVSRVKCFGGRWVNIGRKLEQLPWAVSELCSHPLAGRHALCAEQLDAIVATAQQAARLAAACSTPGVAPAKLQMQSDLDAVAARLDLNLHDCSLLLKSSLLLLCDCDADVDDGAGQPQPQPRPPQLRDLLARLHIGDSESKERALDALLAAMRSDSDCNANAAVAFVRSSRSSVAALVHLLSAATPRIREKAVTVLCAVLQEGEGKDEEEAEAELEAAIGPLVRLVESGSPVAREKAAACLRSLTAASREHTRAVAGHAGVAALVETVAAGASPPQTSRAAAATLLNMAAVAEVRQTLADEGALALMLDTLSVSLSDSLDQQQQLRLAAEFLQNITAGSDSLRRSVAAQGGVKQLLRYLEKCDAAAAAPALGALRNLAWVAGSAALLEEGLLLAAVARVLRGPCPAAQQLALSLMCRMCCCGCSWGVDDVRKQVGESGCMECVIGLLATSAAKGPVAELAAQALAALAVLPANARELRKQHNSRAVIPALVSMLEPWPCGRSAPYKYTIAVLWSMASSKKCRKLMLSLGARIHLKRLSHDDPCAKKLCDRLERPPLSSLLLLTAGARRFG